jgi:HPt (histidine-containing phosphotransfer) domain-containing protein
VLANWLLLPIPFLTFAPRRITYGSTNRWGDNSILMTEVILAREIFERLRQATASDPNTLAELCREYVIEARLTISKLRKALSEGDAAQLRERAHYLKGSSLMIGAKALSQCCAKLEQMGRDSNLSTAATALDETVAELRAVEEELTREVGPVALPAQGTAA